ncbi:hypothetical protein [Denitrificimonas caeni]|uniref:hypothetical protein n=1 Tax=Denitrificimonas caeni TaxID=521720 RepID=UPI0019647455|nr:hypothetical protein [Denitrificimonas caeni]
MNVVKGWARWTVLVAMAAGLAACGGAPSEAEVRQVLQEQIKHDLDKVTGMIDAEDSDLNTMLASMMPKIENIALQGCESEADSVYLCSVEATVTMLGQEKTNIEAVRFKKNKQGEWTMVR